MSDQVLDPSELLSREFDYIAQTAHQAHEDRVRVYQHLLATVGTLLVAAILNHSDVLTEAGLGVDPSWFALLFFILTIVGGLSFLKLVTLRKAWADSVAAMNQIKNYYVDELDEIQLEDAFAWRTDNLPELHRFSSVGFLAGLTVAVVNATSLTASLYFANPGGFQRWYTCFLVATAGVVLLFHVFVWRLLLKKKHEELLN